LSADCNMHNTVTNLPGEIQALSIYSRQSEQYNIHELLKEHEDEEAETLEEFEKKEKIGSKTQMIIEEEAKLVQLLLQERLSNSLHSHEITSSRSGSFYDKYNSSIKLSTLRTVDHDDVDAIIPKESLFRRGQSLATTYIKDHMHIVTIEQALQYMIASYLQTQFPQRQDCYELASVFLLHPKEHSLLLPITDYVWMLENVWKVYFPVKQMETLSVSFSDSNDLASETVTSIATANITSLPLSVHEQEIILHEFYEFVVVHTQFEAVNTDNDSNNVKPTEERGQKLATKKGLGLFRSVRSEDRDQDPGTSTSTHSPTATAIPNQFGSSSGAVLDNKIKDIDTEAADASVSSTSTIPIAFAIPLLAETRQQSFWSSINTRSETHPVVSVERTNSTPTIQLRGLFQHFASINTSNSNNNTNNNNNNNNNNNTSVNNSHHGSDSLNNGVSRSVNRSENGSQNRPSLFAPMRSLTTNNNMSNNQKQHHIAPLTLSIQEFATWFRNNMKTFTREYF